jgi:hypothetical protein
MLSLMLVVIGDLARERLSFQPADLQTRKNEVSQDHCLPTSKQIWVTLKPSSVLHAHPSALAIFRFGWQQIQDLAVMERSQKSAMTTNHSLEPRSIGDFTSEGFTLMTRS